MPQKNTQNPRKLALSVLCKMGKTGVWANKELSYALETSDLQGADRSLAAGIVYGVSERRRLLDFYIGKFSNLKFEKISTEILNTLRCGIYQIVFMDKIPDSAAVNESVKLSRKIAHGGASGFVNAVLRKIAAQKDNLPVPDKDNPQEYISIIYSCSDYIASLFLDRFGFEQTCEIMEYFYNDTRITARVNTLKTDADRLAELLSKEEIRAERAFCHDFAVILEKTGKLTGLDSFKRGLFYVQDISSQTAAEVLGALSNETIVDVCASPGGKSFYCAIKMGNSGTVYSFDKSLEKIDFIKQGAARLGIDIINCEICDAAVGKAELLGKADRVLVDAPCSGLGIMGKKPDIRYKEKDEIEGLLELQQKIIQRSCEYVKQNGTMVYSTCTLNRRENEEVVQRFLSKNPDFSPVDFEVSIHGKKYESQNGMLTLLPNVHKTDGFFMFKCRKN